MIGKKYIAGPLFFVGTLSVVLFSCNKPDKKISHRVELSTNEVSELGSKEAISGGNITSDGGSRIIIRGVCWSTEQTPTILDNKTEDGSGSGEFISKINNLLENKTYYVRAYATNSNGTNYGSTMVFTTNISDDKVGFVDTRDGNVYKTVKIGQQIWMAENLKYLPSVMPSTTGSKITPYYYVFGYNGKILEEAKAIGYYNKFGVLYNWPAAMAGSTSSTANPSGIQGICPSGWHLPSNDEWMQLIEYLGGRDRVGTKLFANNNWDLTDTEETNQSGFSAIPTGRRDEQFSSFSFSIGVNYGFWWSATEFDSSRAEIVETSRNSAYTIDFFKDNGFCVRCVKD